MSVANLESLEQLSSVLAQSQPVLLDFGRIGAHLAAR